MIHIELGVLVKKGRLEKSNRYINTYRPIGI